MPIKALEPRYRRLGKIRMGTSKPSSKPGLKTPVKLDTWRVTSPDLGLIEAVAATYGGTARKWDGAPVGEQFEVLTESDTLRVAIPPGSEDLAFSQWLELWSGGGCQRRCDGEFDSLTGEECVCPTDPEERHALAQKGQACKETTRLNVLLYDVPDIGIWQLETHGYFAAVELGPAVSLLQAANRDGRPLPATLRIEPRQIKRPDEPTKNFIVPVLSLPVASGGYLGLMPRPQAAGELDSGAPVAIGAPPPKAIETTATPTGSAKVTPKWVTSVQKKLEEGGMVEPAEIQALVGHATGTWCPLAEVPQVDATRVTEAVKAFAAGRLVVGYSDVGDVIFNEPVAADVPAGDDDPGRPY